MKNKPQTEKYSTSSSGLSGWLLTALKLRSFTPHCVYGQITVEWLIESSEQASLSLWTEDFKFFPNLKLTIFCQGVFKRKFSL